MRKLPVSVQVSIAVHAVTITGVLAIAKPPLVIDTRPTVTDIEIVSSPPPPPAAPAPVVAPAMTTPAPAIAAPHAPRVARIETPRAPTTSSVPVGPPPPRSAYMMMRRPGDPEAAPRIEVPRAKFDDLDHAPKGTGPEKDASTGQLHPSGGGGFESNQGVFTGKVNPDGTVSIKDAKNFHWDYALPTPGGVGRVLGDWYEEDNKIPNDPDALDSNTKRHHGDDTRPDSGKTVAVAGGGFDVTDWLMRDHNEDPYASKKLAFLDSTRDERVQIGNRHRAKQLQQSPQLMQKNLEALWRATADPAQRKEALFELWDDCAETGDPQLVEAAQAARKLVIGFIRARLPWGTPSAYTEAELAALNRHKQSTAAFAPYE